MENNEKTLSQAAWGQYKKNLSYYLALSFVLLLVGVVIFFADIALSFKGAGGLITLTIPFVFIPFVFSVQYAMTHVRTGENLTSKLIGGGFARYMSLRSPYFGSYGVIRSFFKSLLAYFGGYLLTGIIYFAIANRVDPSFATTINDFAQKMMDDAESFESALELLLSTQSTLSMYVCANGVGTAIASYIFIRSIYINSASTYIRGMMLRGRAPARVGNAIFQFGFRSIRKSYFKEYYKAMWPFIPLTIIGFAGGYIAACFIPVELDIGVLPTFGFAGELILLSFLVPYAFEVQHILTFKYKKEYSQASIDLAKMNLEALKQRQQMSQEQSEEIDSQIKEAEAKMKEAEEKGIDPFEEPSNKDDKNE